MKKKTMAVGGLLLAVAMTGYSVAGTYAKYVSSIDLTDEARVAEWGFKVTDKNGNAISNNEINLFADSYYVDETVDEAHKYVQSLQQKKDAEGNPITVDGKPVYDNVVAPGTSGTYTFKLAGNMEVRYNLSFDIDDSNDFIIYYTTKMVDGVEVLDKAATAKTKETVMQGVDSNKIHEYRPLRYTVKYTRGTDSTELDKNMLTDVTATVLEERLNKYFNDHNAEGFQPGEMNQNYQITWKWATRNTTDGNNKNINIPTDAKIQLVDELDTFAGQNLSDVADTIKFKVTVTATQIAKDYSKSEDNIKQTTVQP